VLALFLGVSCVVFYGLERLIPITEPVREFLGAAPPSGLISLALVIYSFSAIVLILSRMTMAQPPVSGFAHVGFLTGFYGFYYYAGGGAENLWAVLAAGGTIMLLYLYHLRNYCAEELRKERETLAQLERRHHFSGGDSSPID
jgi:hypothetical protein